MTTDERNEQVKFRDDLKALGKEVNSLRVTLIGIDGQNGMRSQISGITTNIKDLEATVRESLDLLRAVESTDRMIHFEFTTKEETRCLKESMAKKLDEHEQKVKSESLRSEDVKYIKWGLALTVVALIASSLLQFLK